MGLFSLLKSMFGTAEPADPVPEAEELYQGFTICPTPKLEGNQYRVDAIIRKGDREHHFIRSDMLMSKADCVEITLRKAKTAIDQQGDSLFG